MAITKLLGFFTIQGSKDYPSNLGLEDKFGFAAGDSGGVPIFSYSMNDVERAFTSGRQLWKSDFYQPKETALLLLEGYNVSGIESVATNTSEWDDIFKIVSYLFRNQTTCRNSSSQPQVYISKGDEDLATNLESNPHYVGGYRKGTLIITASNLEQGARLQSVRFSAQLNGIDVTFDIYLDANAFVDYKTSNNFKVWTHRDSSGDNILTREETNTDIVSKIVTIMNESKLKTYDIKSVERTKTVGGVPTVVYEDFYIFSNKPNKGMITDDRMIVEIKKYLEMEFGYNTELLNQNYPNLFSTQKVKIIPMMNNTKTVNQNTVHVHAADMLRVKEMIESLGYKFDPSDVQYKPYELFHVGYSGELTPGGLPFRYPIIAIEIGENPTGTPIGNRFPNYSPIYGNILRPVGEDWGLFHTYILIALKLISGDIAPQGDSEVDNLKETIELTTNDTSGGDTVYRVRFKFVGTEWEIIHPYRAN